MCLEICPRKDTGPAGLLPVVPTKILGELEESSLSLGSNKNHLIGLWVDVLKCNEIDCDQLVE